MSKFSSINVYNIKKKNNMHIIAYKFNTLPLRSLNISFYE